MYESSKNCERSYNKTSSQTLIIKLFCVIFLLSIYCIIVYTTKNHHSVSEFIVDISTYLS